LGFQFIRERLDRRGLIITCNYLAGWVFLERESKKEKGTHFGIAMRREQKKTEKL